VDVLGGLTDGVPGRERLFGYHGRPGTEAFKMMVREGPYKLIWMANGDSRLLFDVASDPDELHPINDEHPDLVARLLNAAREHLAAEGVTDAFDGDASAGDELKTWEYRVRPTRRIYQFDRSRGVTGFPADPADLLPTRSIV
jgi:choline-sulfatase